jgi:hypothetical protein
MAEFLGVGLTHYPLLAGTDEQMSGLLRWTLEDPDIPAEMKDPSSWSETMRAEWADDMGAAAAARHRSELVENLARCRAALDQFDPDLLVVWGDDQYENFQEEVVPPFCVLAYDDVEVDPVALMKDRNSPNVWGLRPDATITVRGRRDVARDLVSALIDDDFDVAYSYRNREGAGFPHAVLNTQLYLDYEHAGSDFWWPMVAITVNCYGQHVIARRGGLARFADIADERLDPVGPAPRRCFSLGGGVARFLASTNLRVALVASSSWSHAFLCDGTWHLRPDHEADARLYEALQAEDWAEWQKTTTPALVAAGQHEVLNWFCLAGSVAELGLHLRWSSFVSTDVFNSNKCFAIFEEGRI